MHTQWPQPDGPPGGVPHGKPIVPALLSVISNPKAKAKSISPTIGMSTDKRSVKY